MSTLSPEQLSQLAQLLQRWNSIGLEISSLIGRPARSGNIGEAIAASIFDIELTGSGVTAGYDGHFRSGPFAGRTVNVKLYAEDGGLLDISPHPSDLYLVLAGPKPSRRGNRSLPTRIDFVYVIDSRDLLEDLKARGVGIGVATSVRKHNWLRSQVYPRTAESLWPLSDDQERLLRLFAEPD